MVGSISSPQGLFGAYSLVKCQCVLQGDCKSINAAMWTTAANIHTRWELAGINEKM
jgi:hypothetical protein